MFANSTFVFKEINGKKIWAMNINISYMLSYITLLNREPSVYMCKEKKKIEDSLLWSDT